MELLSHIVYIVAVFISGFFPQSHVLGYTAEPLFVTPAPKIHVVFGGDMMFDRSLRLAAEKKGGDFLFSCLDPVLKDADLVVANLEGPITGHASVSATSTPGGVNNFTFTFPTSTAALLFAHNIKLVNIGNNHIMNFSRAGLLETKAYLRSANVGFFGDPDSSESEKVARLEIQGIPLSFVNWSDWTSDTTDQTISQVKAEKASGRIVVVYTHWGDEYVPPPERVKKLAHAFVEAGASLVIGSHPHIVQEHEAYRGSEIYYSLGNLIFDQYWNDAVSHGLLLNVTFSSDGVASIKEIPVALQKDRQTCPVISS